MLLMRVRARARARARGGGGGGEGGGAKAGERETERRRGQRHGKEKTVPRFKVSCFGGRGPARAARPEIGQREVPKDRALADLLTRVVPGIALLACGLLRSRIGPDASAADPRVPPVNGFFFVAFCVATEAPRGRAS